MHEKALENSLRKAANFVWHIWDEIALEKGWKKVKKELLFGGLLGSVGSGLYEGAGSGLC